MMSLVSILFLEGKGATLFSTPAKEQKCPQGHNSTLVTLFFKWTDSTLQIFGPPHDPVHLTTFFESVT